MRLIGNVAQSLYLGVNNTGGIDPLQGKCTFGLTILSHFLSHTFQ